MTTVEHGTPLHEAPLYEAELPRTGYRPAAEYLAEALQGQGPAIAKHVDAHLTNEKTLDLAGAINRAVARAVHLARVEQLEQVGADILAMQAELAIPGDDVVRVDVFDPNAPVTYECAYDGCTEVFPIDMADPMVAHGDYLDHLAEHENRDCEEGPHV